MEDNWKAYQKTATAIVERHLGHVEAVTHLLPDDNYVWRARAAGRSYILKIGPQRPYRLHRELRAYQALASSSLCHPHVVAHGEECGVPYLLLGDCGHITLADLVAGPPSELSLAAVAQTVQQVGILSRLDAQHFTVIRDGLTTRDRDCERLTVTTGRAELFSQDHLKLLERISLYVAQPYASLSHRDLSPRQVVMDADQPTLVDFESIGPGQLERDIGELLGGIAKFGCWDNYYYKVVLEAATGQDGPIQPDEQKIVDYAAYACLWPLAASEDTEAGAQRRKAASSLLGLGTG